MTGRLFYIANGEPTKYTFYWLTLQDWGRRSEMNDFIGRWGWVGINTVEDMWDLFLYLGSVSIFL